MPQTPERKRVYMREYMRRSRARLGFASSPQRVEDKALLVPLTKGSVSPPAGWAGTKGAKHMLNYLQHIHSQGYDLETFEHPQGGLAYRYSPPLTTPMTARARELIAQGRLDQATGEILEPSLHEMKK